MINGDGNRSTGDGCPIRGLAAGILLVAAIAGTVVAWAWPVGYLAGLVVRLLLSGWGAAT